MTNVAESIGVALPDEIPPGWRRTTLGEIGEYINGRGFKKSEWSDRGLPIIRIQNLTGSRKELNYYEGEIDERHVVNPGDLLISWAATLGAYLWAGPRAALNQHIFKVRSFVDRKFHYYLMQHILGDLYRQTHGSGMVHITKSKFDAVPVLIPETEDQQKRIVAEIEKQFSRLDEAVANLKRVKANLKRYKAAVLKAAVEGRLVETEAELARRAAQGSANVAGGRMPGATEGRSYETGEQLLQRILETRRSQWQGKRKYKEPVAPDTTDLPELPEGWGWSTVEQMSSLVEYGSSTKTSEDSSGVPVLRMGNIVEGEVRLDGLKYLPVHHDEFPKLLLKPGDLLFNRTNSPELVGKTAVFADSPKKCSFASYLIRVRLVDGAVPKFLAAYINSSYGRNWVKSVVTQQVGQANVNGTKLQALSVPLPPEAEQHRIMAEVERRLSLLRETEAQVDTNLQRAERLRQSILARSFSGGVALDKPAEHCAAEVKEKSIYE
jgi:type I restriction enzyme, S subunit